MRGIRGPIIGYLRGFFYWQVNLRGVYLSGIPMRKKRAIKKKIVSRSKLSRTKRAPQIFSSKPADLKVHPQVHKIHETIIHDLPFSYGETKLVLLVRDPYWAYSYWDFSGETWNEVQAKMREDSSLKPVMRVHDLDAKHHYDLLISFEPKNWYLHLGTPDRRYVAELGLGDGNSRFYLIVRSNEVKTPRDSPSHVIDPEWSGLDFDEIYRLSGSGKAGLSSPGSLFFPRKSS